MSHPAIQRVRHELKLRELEGEALADFTSLSFDDHVKLTFDDEGAQVRRDYTPRRFSREAREPTMPATAVPALARVRKLLAEKGLPRERTRVSAYWKHGMSAHHENLE